jgi:hypothetical protein
VTTYALNLIGDYFPIRAGSNVSYRALGRLATILSIPRSMKSSEDIFRSTINCIADFVADTGNGGKAFE